MPMMCAARGSRPGGLRLAVVVALTACLFVLSASAHREHKVHNIVLYPEKHSWCKTTPIKQVVAFPGCTSVELDNNVCVGACFSYSIPVTSPSAPGQLIQPYCDSCQPAAVTWRHVSLVCEGDEAMLERVQMIENCSCSTCAGVGASAGAGEPALDGDDTDAVRRPSLLDVPKLMELMMEKHNKSRRVDVDDSPSLDAQDASPLGLTEPMVALLKTFTLDAPEERSTDSGTEANLDPDTLKDLIKSVQGADHRVNQVTLAELVHRVEHSEHIIVDVAKLKRTLAQLVHDEADNSSHEQHPHRQHHRQHSHQHGHQQHGHHQEVHEHGYQVAPSSGDDSPLLLQSHVFNERGGVGIEGPRPRPSGPVPAGLSLGLGSLGSLGGGLDPTLDVSPHHLKPALAGSQVSYHENIVMPEREEHSDEADESF